MKRREFLSSLAVLTGAALLRPTWAFGNDLSYPSLVVIFLRGGNDGINTLVPYADNNYYALRPTLALPRPGKPNGVIPLNAYFALHPALAPLKSIYDSGELAFLPAVHYPNPNLSHFESQKLLESGSLSPQPNGWLNRYLSSREHIRFKWRAVAIGNALPHSMEGDFPVSVIAGGSIPEFWGWLPGYKTELPKWWQETYTNSSSSLVRTMASALAQGLSDFQTLKELKNQTPSGSYPNTTLGESLKLLAQMFKSNSRPEIAALDIGGWDTHAQQAQIHSKLLGELAAALNAFYGDLVSLRQQLLIVVMSEFGRNLRENGAQGTDHGQAGLWMVLGGKVKGGIVGDWPGISPAQLTDGAYLRATCDFRDVLGEILQRHLNLSDPGQVLLGHRYQTVGFLA